TNTVAGSILENLEITDALPAGLTLVDGTIQLNGEDVEAEIDGNTFTVVIPELKGEETVLITFTAKVSEDAAGENINVATVTDPTDPENPKEPEVPVTVIPDGEFTAEKLVNKDAAKPGDDLEYT